ncbi:hypothetical protein JTE90_012257 [Oedothorax gibbosus]|uniref:Ribosomal RNA-processing protein 8 n=1 Tax=Oedothorax gibbosus TaxID=931172 RepID=A0AAV6VIQ9_9ARAC|nr:hypothetical protein JTE90_012257 [Oedothorax gibbosus]
MIFSADEGDVWDSTPTQDLFIQKYFATKESSNAVVSKRERKRKMKLASNKASTSMRSENRYEHENSNKKLMPNSKKLHLAEEVPSRDSLVNNVSKKDNFKRKKLNLCKNLQNDNVPSISKDGKTNINSYVTSMDEEHDFPIKQLKKKRKLNIANKLSQTLNAEKNLTSVQNFIVSPESNDTNDELSSTELQTQNKKKSNAKKISEPDQFSESDHEDLPKVKKPKKKKKEKPNEPLQIKNEPSVNKAKVKIKKLKGAKNLSNVKDSTLQNNKPSLNEAKEKTKKLKKAETVLNAKESSQNDSDNSEDDDDIRNELKNSRMFLKIQKLMKLAPHLNPSYCEDSDENAELSSCDDISSEYSSLESEDECSEGDDNETLIKDEEESVDVSEDSSNEVEEDSVDVSEDSSNKDEEDSSDSEESSDNYEKNTKSLESNLITSKKVEQTPYIEIQSPTTKKPATFMEKARSKLAAAKFRFLNEKLYTETGGEAYRYFQENGEEFEDYHLGYRQQVSKWPLNPVDEILKDLQKLKKDAVIADLGCGEAKIARVLSNRTIHSFDLVAKHKCVTACDFSKVPLKDTSVDVAVFCLSLMGVNLVDYLREAYRILKMGGTLKIAEVESRIENLDIFIENLKTLGFVLERQNLKNKLFVFLDLKKVKKKKSSKAATITLRPCMYKKR